MRVRILIVVGSLCDILKWVSTVLLYFRTLTLCQIHQLYLTGRGGNLVEFKGVRGMAAQSQPNALAT